MKNAEACIDKAIETGATDQSAAREMARECLKELLDAGHGADKKKGKSG